MLRAMRSSTTPLCSSFARSAASTLRPRPTKPRSTQPYGRWPPPVGCCSTLSRFGVTSGQPSNILGPSGRSSLIGSLPPIIAPLLRRLTTVLLAACILYRPGAAQTDTGTAVSAGVRVMLLNRTRHRHHPPHPPPRPPP